jgi:LysM repeat protein
MRILFSFLLVICFTAAQAQSPQAVTAYVERYKAIAIEEMKLYGIPASVTLAQGIHESGCGCSALALNSNNHFGIKCHNEWGGQTYHHDDDLPQECFRVYKCAEESFRDHSEFLKNRARYASLFSLAPTDYRSWARGLKAAGYATNPHYPDIIIKLIEDYKLNQYDKPGTQTATTAKVETKEKNNEVDLIKQSIIQSSQTPAPAATANPTTSASIVKTSTSNAVCIDFSKYTSDERTVNGTKALVYKKEVPLSFIAQKYNITLQQLYAYNDMYPSDKFRDNDLIYVEGKKIESPYFQYEVSDGETMHDIAQKFAVQLSELIKRNGITAGCEPVPGEIVVLRGKREVPLRFRVTSKTYPSKTSAETTAPVDLKVHKVGTSETLYSISKQYNIPLDTLKKLNGLKDEDIKIGQTLIVDSQ